MIIDKHYINAAIKIRKEYLGLNDKLKECEKELKKESNNLLKESANLDNLNDNLGDYNSPEDAQEAVFTKLNDIDVHIKSLNNIYSPINDKIEELKEREIILYNNIKKAYSNLSDEDIISQINVYISKS